MARLAALPQFWLAVFVIAGLVLGRIVALPVSYPVQVAGLALAGAGIAMMMWAAATLARARTSMIPGVRPKALVTQGPFRFSRNPIYLGDLLLMAGILIALDAAAGVVMVPFFGWLLADRFIRLEEKVIEAEFGEDFRSYMAKTRRWL